MEYSESQEMYLKAIYQISLEKNEVRKIDIAKELGLSKPSVTNAINRLISLDMVQIDETNGILLTATTRAYAEKLYVKYRTIFELLVANGVSKEHAKEAACKLEHALDDDIFNLIVTHTK